MQQLDHHERQRLTTLPHPVMVASYRSFRKMSVQAAAG
jgi:hypothetical protein